MASLSNSDKFRHTTGVRDPVWVHGGSYEDRPSFRSLAEDIETDVCIVGAGIAGISIAYELVRRGREVVLLDARDVISGETSRTTGHLSNALDDGYVNIAKKHGNDGAKHAIESHAWAIERVGEISQELGIECEYRRLPAYQISQYQRGTAERAKDVEEMKKESKLAASLGLDAAFDDGLAIKGWEGGPDQRGGIVYGGQATFHPTLYVIGVLNWLKNNPLFRCHSFTRVTSVEEKGIEILGIGNKSCIVTTDTGKTIKCNNAVEATNVPLQKLSVIAQMEWFRTYAIALRIPKGALEDCLLYDTAEPYHYVRLANCDSDNDYVIVGGADHKVGQDKPEGRFEQLESWTRERLPQAGSVDFKWSGQVFEPVDYMAYIGKNQGNSHIYIVTGDSGNGLTHGVLAGKLIADEITDQPNPWSSLYSPKRLSSVMKSAGQMISHDLQANMQYKRLLQSDIQDIEDLVPGTGGVLNPLTSMPIAVYKDENGQVTKMSALCPHLKGVVCWNGVEKSWDCPVHGSRFADKGTCVQGPAKMGLSPIE